MLSMRQRVNLAYCAVITLLAIYQRTHWHALLVPIFLGIYTSGGIAYEYLADLNTRQRAAAFRRIYRPESGE